MMNSQGGFEKQDANIANIIESEGKPFVVAINKWDLVKNKKEKERLKSKLRSFFHKLVKLVLLIFLPKKTKVLIN